MGGVLNLVLSISSSYAVHALHYIAARTGHRPVLTREISENFNIPYDSTLKILRQLSRAGLVKSFRGCRGGFTLTCEAEEITLLQVVETVDGPLEYGLEMPGGSGDRELCTKAGILFREAAQELKRKLQTCTLADLMAGESVAVSDK